MEKRKNRSLIIEKGSKIKIPKNIIKHLEIKPGDTINYTLENVYQDGQLHDNVIMIKKPV